MKKALMLMGLAAAIACGSSAGDMIDEALDDIGDVPDVRAQDDPIGEPGPPGEVGPQGEPGHPVVFCADFGAFCGFSPDTLESMSDCGDAISQLDDDGVVCVARNLQAAKSGETGGCGAIAALDPCSFTPAPAEAPSVVVNAVATTPDAAPMSIDYPYNWGCTFDSTKTVAIGDDTLMFLSLHGFASANTNREIEFTAAYRLLGDTTNGTILDINTVPTGPSLLRDFVSASFVSPSLPAGTYEVGACVRQNEYCRTGDCGYFATLTRSGVSVITVATGTR